MYLKGTSKSSVVVLKKFTFVQNSNILQLHFLWKFLNFLTIFKWYIQCVNISHVYCVHILHSKRYFLFSHDFKVACVVNLKLVFTD